MSHYIDQILNKIAPVCPQKKCQIAVGLSGGVDSSVTAALLKELGYSVVGLFMKNWEEEDCPAVKDFEDVARTADVLQIPYFPINFVREYKEEVFSVFLEELKKGNTPNPDILCNLEIKFKHLLHKAMGMGADFLATGHYARQNIIQLDDLQYKYSLERAADTSKDQTYFLYTASQKTLARTVFPLALLLKKEVRDIARALQLPIAEKKDSTGICFIGERNFRSFISQFVGYTPGNIVTSNKTLVGTHQGLAYHTLGQRRGLNIGGPGAAWFVVGKNIKTNELIVEQGADHPALYSDRLFLESIHWISDKEPVLPLECTAQIRYRQAAQPCIVSKTNQNQYCVQFFQPQRAITSGQACVLYLQSVCLGGGTILPLQETE